MNPKKVAKKAFISYKTREAIGINEVGCYTPL